MSQKKNIIVTEQHIRNGKRANCRECAVALALKDAGITNPSVNDIGIWNGELNGQAAYGYLPSRVIDEVHRFDNGCSIEPFEFNTTAELYNSTLITAA